MTGTNAEEIRKHVRVYVTVFAALGLLTAVTVGVSYIHLDLPKAIVVAMVVAAVKGTLVAGYFMHLFSERKVIFATLALCAVFFIALMALPAFTVHENVTVPHIAAPEKTEAVHHGP